MPLSTFEGTNLIHSGTVTGVEREERIQTMYNLTVAEAHTFFVGEGEWLVHNTGRNCNYWTKKLIEYEGVLLDKDMHLDAALREINGEVVMYKADGITPFNHVQDVQNNQNGARNLINDLVSQLQRGNVPPGEAAQMEALISRASRTLDYSERYVPPGSVPGF